MMWKNIGPSSFRFLTVTAEVSKLHFHHMENNIENLQPSATKIGYATFTVIHELFPCMVDGKVCSALASTLGMVHKLRYAVAMQ